MIKCLNCSFENPDSHKFCQDCGSAIAELKIMSPDLIIPNQIPDLIIQDTAPDLIIQNDDTEPELSNPVFTKLRFAGLSDVGKERDHNEDGFRCFCQTMTTASHDQPKFQTYRGLFILCDGMGGHDGGEVASKMALESVTKSLKPFWTSGLPGKEKITEIIAVANDAIYDLNETEMRQEIQRMGTTLVLMMIYAHENATEVAIAHVGDSRIYQISDFGLTQLTQDHEVANKLISQGMDAKIANERPDANQLTQALGPNLGKTLEPEINFFKLDSTTVFLLCSDGLSDNQILETKKLELMQLLPANTDLNLGVKNLIQAGNDLNGYDNISAILVHCQFDN